MNSKVTIFVLLFLLFLSEVNSFLIPGIEPRDYAKGDKV